MALWAIRRGSLLFTPFERFTLKRSHRSVEVGLLFPQFIQTSSPHAGMEDLGDAKAGP